MIVTGEAEDTGGGEYGWPFMYASKGLSYSSSSTPSKVDVEACCCTWMMVLAVSSGGRGDLESMRLKKFVELLRSTRLWRAGFFTTLRKLALSGSGEPERLEGLLPIMTAVIGVFGRRFDRSRGTCAIVAQLAEAPLQIFCLSSCSGMVVEPLVRVSVRSEGRGLRMTGAQRGGHACSVDTEHAASSCLFVETGKVV